MSIDSHREWLIYTHMGQNRSMPKPSIPASCVHCGRPMIHGEGAHKPDGFVRHKSRGMCQSCHSDARRDGRLDDYPRNRRQTSETVEIWEMLAMLGYSKHEAAQKLGMSTHGLNRALQRARVIEQRELEAAQIAEVTHINQGSGHDDAVAA